MCPHCGHNDFRNCWGEKGNAVCSRCHKEFKYSYVSVENATPAFIPAHAFREKNDWEEKPVSAVADVVCPACGEYSTDGECHNNMCSVVDVTKPKIVQCDCGNLFYEGQSCLRLECIQARLDEEVKRVLKEQNAKMKAEIDSLTSYLDNRGVPKVSYDGVTPLTLTGRVVQLANRGK